MDLPDEIKFPCDKVRLSAFLDEAIALLGVDVNENSVMAMDLNILPQDFAHRLAAYDRETTAKEEKRIASKIKTHADALAKLLEDAPWRVKNHLGFWLGGLERHQPDTPFKPDTHWEGRHPRTIDTVQGYVLAVGLFAGTFAEGSLPKPATTPQRWLLNRAMTLALRCGKTLDEGVKLAGMAHWVVFGKKPKGDDWGNYEKNHFMG